MSSLEPGQSIGRYRVIRLLGTGAMGEVYLAEDPQIERQIALKTVRVGGAAIGLEERKLRLLQEAKAAGRLLHPNAVTLFDAGSDGELLYLAFEFVDGPDLAGRLAAKPALTLAQALSITRQAAEALAHAHRLGIVHRDIKPSNLLLDSTGRVKVSDFGIAKIAGQQTELTATGSVLGSPHYLSPEQVKGETLDGRSDIFSLGVVLYEMLSGGRPFQGDTITTLIYQILHREPAKLPGLPAGVGPSLEGLLDRMLAKDRDQRFGSAEELAATLGAMEADLGLGAGPLQLPDLPATGPMTAVATPPDPPSGTAPAVSPSAVFPAPSASDGLSASGSSSASTGPTTASTPTATGGAPPSGESVLVDPTSHTELLETGDPGLPPPPPVPSGMGGAAPGQGGASRALSAHPGGAMGGGSTAFRPVASDAGAGRRRLVLLAGLAAAFLVLALGAFYGLRAWSGSRADGPASPGGETEARLGEDGALGDLPSGGGEPNQSRLGGGDDPLATVLGSEDGEASDPPAEGTEDVAPRPSPTETGGAAEPPAPSPSDAGRAREAESSRRSPPPSSTEGGGRRVPEGASSSDSPAPRRDASRSAELPRTGAAGAEASDATDDPPSNLDELLPEPGDGDGAETRIRGVIHHTAATGLGLTFRVEPEDAYVLVDGTLIGQADEVTERGLYTLSSSGEHLVVFRKAGMDDYRVRVIASDDGPGRSLIPATLRFAAASELAIEDLMRYTVREGLVLKVQPRGAVVRVDGEVKGQVSQFSGFGRGFLRLDRGLHRVSLEAEGFQRVDLAVDVTAGASEDKEVIRLELPKLPP